MIFPSEKKILAFHVNGDNLHEIPNMLSAENLPRVLRIQNKNITGL